jgi:hypothetical protein
MGRSSHFKVTGVRNPDEANTEEKLSLVYWLMSKNRLRERREQAVKAKARAKCREHKQDER